MKRPLPVVWFLLAALALAWGYRGLADSWFLRDDFMWLFDSRIQLQDPVQFLTTRPSGYFRPFANLVFGLEHAFFGLEPAGFYAVNVLIHGWSAFWLAKLVRSFGGSLGFAGASAVSVCALTAAAPGVVWISGLVSLLAVAMVLPALYFYHRFQKGGELGALAIAWVCTVLAVCSRESGVLAGVGIVCMEARAAFGVFSGKSGLPRPAFKAWALAFGLRMLPFALAGAGYLFVQWDFLTGDAGARGAPGSPLGYVQNVLTSLPALLRPEEWRLGFSLGGGVLISGGLVLVLGALRGRRGIKLGLWLVVLLHVAFLPTYPLLSADYVMANRYRYEAVFVVAVMIGALVDALAGWSAHPDEHGARSGLRRSAAACALLGALVVWHLAALPRFVDQDPRFARYADATHAMHRQLEEHFGEALVGARLLSMMPSVEGTRRVALVGVPVENPRHLRDHLTVFFDFPSELTAQVHVELADPQVTAQLRGRQAGYVKALTGVDEVWVWQPDGSLKRGVPVLAPLLKDWRRPGRQATSAKVQVLEFPQP